MRAPILCSLDQQHQPHWASVVRVPGAQQWVSDKLSRGSCCPFPFQSSCGQGSAEGTGVEGEWPGELEVRGREGAWQGWEVGGEGPWTLEEEL